VQDGEMPPEEEKPRPTAEEISALKAWIDNGAPPFPTTTAGQRKFVSDEAAMTAVRDHLRALTAPNSQQFQRYFSLANVHNNPSVSDEDLRWHRAALAKVVNSLSWKAGIVVPMAIDKDETVFVVDLRDLDWEQRRIWDELSKHYPYGLKLDGVRNQ